jgi:hypothetical protein
MVPEDINYVYQFFIQIRKPFNKPRGKPLAALNKNTSKSFEPIFIFPTDMIKEQDFVRPIV